MSMELTKRLWEQPTDKGVLAYHIIQSFSPGEATPDQVHEIGCEFARRFLADRFECTVSTHLDKGHLHNHIVVNSVSYADGKMFRNNFDTYYHGIRQVSDELCRENRLSVIETDGKGKSYDEWLSGQAGKPTIRGMVRKDVEQAIAAADSFDGFILELHTAMPGSWMRCSMSTMPTRRLMAWARSTSAMWRWLMPSSRSSWLRA